MKRIYQETNAEHLWSVFGDFPMLTGEVITGERAADAGQHLSGQNEAYRLSLTRNRDQSGVICQKSTFTNLTDRPLHIGQLLSRFVLDGGEYEVYTQLNGWQKESIGTWQPLMSTVMAESPKMRFCDGAAPFLAVRNRQTGRGLAFHLLAEGAWQMSAAKQYLPGETCNIYIELGLNSRNLHLEVAPGASVAFPEILFYEFRNATDLDCYKLHDYCNRRFPTWKMPVIYNTWLYRFDLITFENVMKQVGPAAEVGAEYFVIDAGWFGNGKASNWADARGDWSESLTYGFCGRMNELADAVRAAGMKFGLWLEPEIATPTSDAIQEHGEWYIKEGDLYFLNFADPAAVDYIYGITCGLIDRYGIEFIKFDYNASMLTDPLRQDFLVYFEGYNRFLAQIKAKYPDIYLSCCASGGLQTNLSICNNYDGIWISDNQSIYDSMRIFKDSLLRMPPQMLEKWSVITSLTGVTPDRYSSSEKILSTDDATWSRAIEVHESLLRGFMQASPIGLSYDLTGLTKKDFKTVQDTIRRYKEERSFWQTAVCRILTDTESMLVLQFSDRDLNRSKLLVYSKRICQQLLTVYPVVQADSSYRISADFVTEPTVWTGAELDADGIDIPLNGNYRYTELTLEKITYAENKS